MLWEQDRDSQYGWKNPVQNRSRKDRTLSHGFSDRPYMNNSRMVGGISAANTSEIYSAELWHYGIKGMHWGEINEKPSEKGTSGRQNNSRKIAAETAVKIASLKKTKEQMRQKKENKKLQKQQKKDQKKLFRRGKIRNISSKSDVLNQAMRVHDTISEAAGLEFNTIRFRHRAFHNELNEVLKRPHL